MPARRPALAASCALTLAVAACGSDGAGAGGAAPGPNPNDKRAVALRCLTEEKGLDARLLGEKSIEVDGPTGPRIEFFLSSGEAEALQFQGKAQGAEQVGAALLFVNQGDDELLEQVEACLNEQ